MPTQTFSKRVVEAIDGAKILGIRAGDGPHRVIGIWVVVVEGRVFVRSWDSKAGGWYKTLREDPRGIITVGERELRMRASFRVGERMRDAIDRAYGDKYPTPGSREYVLGFARPRRRETTTELLPR
jgi:hypothetical protein